MNRKATLGILVSCLLLLLASGSGISSNAAQKAGGGKSFKWTKSATCAAQVSTVQNPPGYTYPESAGLQMSGDDFTSNFETNSKLYVNKCKVFSNDVNEVVLIHAPQTSKSKALATGDMTVWISHDNSSHAVAIASPSQ